MEPNPLPALVAAMAGTGLAPIVVYVPLVVAISAVLAAIFPQPASNSPWFPLRRLLDLLAMNVGSARNLPSAPASTSSSTLPAVLLAFGLAASVCACSTAQNAQIVSDVQTASVVAAQDARLFCAVATPAGPLVVSVANAAGAPVVATGTATAIVNAACGAINGIPVAPPATGSVVPMVAASVPNGTPTKS